MGRFIAGLMAILLAFAPVIVSAQKCETCTIAIIKKGKIAPFDGFLYNNDAHADQRAQLRLMEDEFELKLKYELDMQRVDLQFDTATTAAALDALQQRYDEVVPDKNRQIKFLQNKLVEADKKGSDGSFYFALGLGLGVAGGIIVSALAIWGATELGKAVN